MFEFCRLYKTVPTWWSCWCCIYKKFFVWRFSRQEKDQGQLHQWSPELAWILFESLGGEIWGPVFTPSMEESWWNTVYHTACSWTNVRRTSSLPGRFILDTPRGLLMPLLGGWSWILFGRRNMRTFSPPFNGTTGIWPQYEQQEYVDQCFNHAGMADYAELLNL